MLLKLSKFFLYASLFSVVVVLSTIFFPFIGGKYYFFRVCIELALIGVVLWWAFEAETGALSHELKRVYRHPLVRAVTVFALAFLVAAIFAYDSSAAFWSNYERGEGAFQMLHYYAFFVLLVLLFTAEEDWRLAFKVSIVAGTFMILYGLAAAALFNGFIGPYRAPDGSPTLSAFLNRIFSDNRFQGSLGNPAYVAPYLLFTLFYCSYLWRTSFSRWLAHASYGAAAIFSFTFFLLSGTRGAFAGLLVALAVFFGYLIYSQPKLRKGAAITVALLVLVGAPLFYYRDTPFVKSLPASRVLELTLTQSSAQTRLWTWGSALKGVQERPFFGWGPENFTAVFDKYFDTRHFIPGKNAETWFDRAHSVVFDYLTETGIIGFVSYAAVFVVFYWLVFRRIRRERKREGDGDRTQKQRAVVEGLMLALPVGYLVQALILFDVIPIYINLFLFLAFGAYWVAHTGHAGSGGEHVARRNH